MIFWYKIKSENMGEAIASMSLKGFFFRSCGGSRVTKVFIFSLLIKSSAIRKLEEYFGESKADELEDSTKSKSYQCAVKIHQAHHHNISIDLIKKNRKQEANKKCHFAMLSRIYPPEQNSSPQLQ